ncbi:MAG: amidohydrolase [Mycobacteriaceae bacterium]|uniref:amidohydrolase n=1 Tax=Corynebacterium sp. TaxID=1720 RepID=UPI003F97B5FE
MTAAPADIVADAALDRDWLTSLYKDLHQHPELSGAEEWTAIRIGLELRRFTDWEVTTGIGGYGITAVLRNGDGPTVLFRSDFDGLPVAENSGVDYASTHTQLDSTGLRVPTMHACGHDAHTSSALAAMRIIDGTRDRWQGTVVFLFQPAEEAAIGAHGMVKDGLRTIIPRPDVCLGQHVVPGPSGLVFSAPGPVLTSSTTLEVTLFGRGAHASMPHRSVDPVVLAASVVMKLQTVVSREMPPGKFAVVTVASVEAGKASNVIPDSARITLSCRFYEEELRTRAVDAIKRIVRSEAMAAGCEREPEFKFLGLLSATDNDPRAYDVVRPHLDAFFGEESREMEPWTASEDFSVIPRAFGAPYLFWTVGITPRTQWKRAEKAGRLDIDVPTNHNPGFLPDINSLPVTTQAAAVAVLGCLAHDWPAAPENWSADTGVASGSTAGNVDAAAMRRAKVETSPVD